MAPVIPAGRVAPVSGGSPFGPDVANFAFSPTFFETFPLPPLSYSTIKKIVITIKMKNQTILTPILTAVCALALSASAQDAKTLPPAATKAGVTYDGDVKAFLDKSCVHCHSGEKPKARLKLDTLDNILKGGRNGKVVTVGDSAKSVLVQAAAHTTDDEDEWMPPAKAVDKYPNLTADQIGLLRAWIDQGAK